MESRELRNLVVVAEHTSFRQAATHLHLTQPALSRQIKALETSLGVDLFDRSRRGVVLTESGWLVYRRTVAALAAIDGLSDAAGGATGEVELGYHDAGAIAFIPALGRALADVDGVPTIRLVLRPWSDRDAGVSSGITQVAVVRTAIHEGRVQQQILNAEPRVFAVPADSAYAVLTGLVARALAGVVDVKSPVEVLPLPLWNLVGAKPALCPETVEEALSAVAAGHVALLPASVAAMHPRPGVTYVRALDAGMSTMSLAWRSDHVAPVAADLIAIIRAVGSGILASMTPGALVPPLVPLDGQAGAAVLRARQIRGRASNTRQGVLAARERQRARGVPGL
jgi:DNA-binding transcriptional LysR family regulator